MSDTNKQYVSDNNSLSGSLPEDLFDLQKLQLFYIPNNFMSGSIPESMGHLEKLFFINFSSNQLTSSLPYRDCRRYCFLLSAVLLCDLEKNRISCNNEKELLSFEFIHS